MASNQDSNSDNDSETEIRVLNTKQNKKKKKSGGFQSMGLSHPVFKGVMKLGYKIPTPIQRKTIPEIINGHDVVAMARTGSGKTAAFLIPMFEKLKSHSACSARALIISPTRELSLQTLKFTKELGKFTGLKAAVILGGDRMEDQFAALHENPDIIIATPGRLLHVLVEMNLKLKTVEYLVFDEADRLFDQGFQNELTEILRLVPEARQTLLFSATLPKCLVEFAKAGLSNPTLIRLDVDTKLSPHLKMSFLRCRVEVKTALTLHLLQHIIPHSEQVVIFVATKHHAEYLGQLLVKAEIEHCCVYGSLDQTHRKISVAKFRNRKARVLVVTDVAARGIDLPLLENVLNYHFPAQAKLFIHRVGRVARAGKSGTAFSLVSPDEMPYLVDLHVFLGRPINMAFPSASLKDESGLIGGVPQNLLDEQEEIIEGWHRESVDLTAMKRVCANAMRHYLRSRPASSSESLKRSKTLERDVSRMAVHPLFGEMDDSAERERFKLLAALKTYKSSATVFEINATSKKTGLYVMKDKRRKHDGVIEHFQKWQGQPDGQVDVDSGSQQQEETVDNDELEAAFANSKTKKRKRGDVSATVSQPERKKKKFVRDEENFIPYRPSDFESERGLTVGGFQRQVEGAVLDMMGDEDQTQRKMRTRMKWDKKRKRFVNEFGADNKKKIVTESGARIAASFKTRAYAEWKKKYNIDEKEEENGDEERHKNQGKKGGSFVVLGTGNKRWHQARSKGEEKTKGSGRRERKSKDEILKKRKQQARVQHMQQRRQKINKKNKNIHSSKNRRR